MFITELDPNKVEVYEKWVEDPDDAVMRRLYKKIGMIVDGKFYRYITFNKFSDEPLPIPDETWKNMAQHAEETYQENIDEGEEIEDKEKYISETLQRRREYIVKHICDPTAKIFKEKDNIFKGMKSDWDIYPTKDNGGIGYVVCVKKDESEVLVYGRTKAVILVDIEDPLSIFTELVARYRPITVFIGKSPLNDMTGFSGGHGPRFDGNTILLEITAAKVDTWRYAQIDSCIYEFSTDEPIHTYISSVGNNCVPYPYAESDNWCYADGLRTTVTDHPNRLKRGFVSYVDEAKYEELNGEYIGGRNTDRDRHAASSREDTRVCKLIPGTKMRHVQGTCN